MEELFEFEGQEYTLAEVQKAAEAKSLNIDDYIKEYNISRKPGKTTPTSLGADVEETAAPKIGMLDLDSNLVNTLLESPNKETQKQFLSSVENFHKDDLNNYLKSLLKKYDAGFLTNDNKINPGLNAVDSAIYKERLNKVNKEYNNFYNDIAQKEYELLLNNKAKEFEAFDPTSGLTIGQNFALGVAKTFESLFDIGEEGISKGPLLNAKDAFTAAKKLDAYSAAEKNIEARKQRIIGQGQDEGWSDKVLQQQLNFFTDPTNSTGKKIANSEEEYKDFLKINKANASLEMLSKLAKADQQFLQLFESYGPDSEIIDENGNINLTFGKTARFTGQQFTQLLFSAATAPIAPGRATYMQEIGPMMTEALEQAAIKEFGEEAIAKMDDGTKREKYATLIEEGKLDLSKLETSAIFSGLLDTAGAVFQGIKIAKAGAPLLRNIFKRKFQETLKIAVNKGADIGLATAGETLTEIAQEGLNVMGVAEAAGTKQNWATKRFGEVGLQTLITTPLLVGGGRGVKSTATQLKRSIQGAYDPNSLRAEINNQIKVVNMLEKNQSISSEQAANEIDNLYAAEDVISNSLYKNFESEAQAELIDIIAKEKGIKRKIDKLKNTYNAESVFSAGQVKALEEQLNEIENDKQAVIPIQNYLVSQKKLLKHINNNSEKYNNYKAFSFDTNNELIDFVKRNNISEKIINNITAKEEFSFGAEIPNKKIILFSKENIKRAKGINKVIGSNVIHHELGHVIMSSLSDKDINNFIKNITIESNKLPENSKLKEAFELAKARVKTSYSEESNRVKSEEILTSMSDFLRAMQGDILIDDASFLSKTFSFLAEKLNLATDEQIDFSGLAEPQQALQFLQKYNKSLGNSKNLFQRIKKASIGGAKPEISDEIEKFSKSVSGENIQKIFDEKGKDGAFDIIEAYKPLTTKLTNKYRDVPGFDFELLQSEIEIGKRGLLDLINAYDPSKGATLNTYIQGQLANRSIEAANRILDTEFTLDVTEAKGVTDTTTEKVTERVEQDKPAERVSLRKQLGLDETIKPIVVNAVKKTFGTRLPEVTSKEFRPELEKRFRTELKKPLAKLMGRTEDYRSFLSNNFGAIYEAIPQYVINRRFNAFAEVAVDANGKPLREKTAEGKKIFTKKKIVKAEWLKYFLGDDVGRSTQGTRKTALAEALAEQFAYDATMEVLADPKVIEKIKGISELTGQKFVDNYLDEVSKAIERPTTFKFSLSTKIESDWVTDPLNPLSGDKKYNFTVGKIPFESKVFNEPDFEYEIFEGTFGIEDGTLADDPKSVLLAFSEKETGSTEILGTATQGLTSAFQVFGTVANSTIDLVKKEKLNSVAFTAKEKSRIRLYNALAHKFAKELGWDYYAFPLNEGETGFIAYDPKIIPSDENSNVSKDVIKFSKSTGVFDRDGNKVLFKDELGNVFDAVSKKIKLSPKTKFAFFEKEFLNYCKNNFKKGNGDPYNAKFYRSIAWEYYAGKQIEFLNPDLKLVNDFKGFSNKGIGDLEFLQISSGKKIYAEVKLLNKKGKWPQMGSGGIVFDYDSDTFIKPKKGNPIEIFDYVVAVLKKEGYNNKSKKVLDKLGIKNLSDLTPGMVPLFDKLKKELNITIPLGDATNIINSYAKKGVNLMVSGNDVSNLKIHSLDTNNYGLDIPTLKGNGSLVIRAVYSNKGKGYVSLRVINTIKDVNEGLPVKEFKPVSKASKSLNKEFNQLLQATTGVEWFKTFSPAKARLVGKGKGKRKLFIPYSADDFVGLLYATLGRNKTGDKQMAWYEENLIRPFSRGIQKYEAAKQKALREWMILKKQVKKDVPGGLNKANETGFTNQNSVRMYIWAKQGMEIPGAAKKDINDNVKIVNDNPALKSFAERLIALNPEGYPKPGQSWDAGDITTDLVSYINDVRRAEFLTEWNENVKEIFNDTNKEKLRALYGDSYIEALEDMLHRMKTGRNRKFGASKIEKQFMDWTNNSVGAIMFFNARSAVLQTLSAVNFINFSDNNPINAGIAFANQKQYWRDFSTLFNSDFLKQRRTGLQTDVNADEIANAAAGSTNKAKAVLSAILKLGFTPTQIADSFAIASGGATMYRNRIKKYLKEGLDQEAAEKRAFTDFQEIAEETQQSARPDRISMQQASSLGRLILAFGNTPMQYARLTKKAALDLVNGRGDWKTNISKIAYYSVIQNIIFSALQSGLFALLFDEEDEDKEKSRYYDIANKSFDTLLRGSGVYGAAASTVKNMILRIIEEGEKSRPDYRNVAITATEISPPINSKIKKLLSAGSTFTYKQSKEKVFTEGFSLENPAFLAAGKVISAGTNLPADRVVQKADHIYTAMQPETELWQAIALSLGWSEWDLGMIEKQTKKSKTSRSINRTRTRTRTRSRSRSN